MNQIKLEDEKENIDSNLWTKFIQSVSIIKKIEEKKDSIFYEAKTFIIIVVVAFIRKYFKKSLKNKKYDGKFRYC